MRRRDSGTGRGARGRGTTYLPSPPHPGGAGPRPPGTKTRMRGARWRAGLSQAKARPGVVRKTPRWRAERRHASETVRDKERMDAPLGAPSPSVLPRGKKVPGASRKRRRRTRRRKKYGRRSLRASQTLSPLRNNFKGSLTTQFDIATLPSATERLRAWVNLLCFWRLCDRRTCRRAYKCSGNPHFCFPRYTPLLPEGVQDFYASLRQSRADGQSFEKAMSLIDEAGLDHVLDDWHATVEASLRPSRDGPQADA
jgi:hypothetical protein